MKKPSLRGISADGLVLVWLYFDQSCLLFQLLIKFRISKKMIMLTTSWSNHLVQDKTSAELLTSSLSVVLSA